MSQSATARQATRAAVTHHTHTCARLPKSIFFCDGYRLARALSNDAQQLLQKPKPALAIPLEVLQAAERCGAQIVVLTRQTGARLYAPLAAWRGARSFIVDRQFGTQRALPLEAMFGSQAEAEAAAERSTAGAVQPDLFGAVELLV